MALRLGFLIALSLATSGRGACPSLYLALEEGLPRFATESYDLRPLQADDFEKLKAILQDPEAVQMSGADANDAYIRRIVAESARPGDSFDHWKLLTLGVRDRKTGSLVGLVQFYGHTADGRATLGFALEKGLWGRGLTTRMVSQFVDFGFKELGLSKIEASTLQTNVGAGRVLQKVGFRKTGERSVQEGTLDDVFELNTNDDRFLDALKLGGQPQTPRQRLAYETFASEFKGMVNELPPKVREAFLATLPDRVKYLSRAEMDRVSPLASGNYNDHEKTLEFLDERKSDLAYLTTVVHESRHAVDDQKVLSRVRRILQWFVPFRSPLATGERRAFAQERRLIQKIAANLGSPEAFLKLWLEELPLPEESKKIFAALVPAYERRPDGRFTLDLKKVNPAEVGLSPEDFQDAAKKALSEFNAMGQRGASWLIDLEALKSSESGYLRASLAPYAQKILVQRTMTTLLSLAMLGAALAPLEALCLGLGRGHLCLPEATKP